ncbi:antibiotic biosynthesis monooxygenase family protein [Solimicrobium silvestre]|uniref:Antibiotic biosynthesis monooxygenase n=1 Tax=Solimicrobium silvestre TaxID=2099400 RepID=A0A2S9GTP4_9BURK|nr:antibiotic biosynthesis monooxygenase [Solimicrobium silvestre]PRC91066.1 Antibiotic biosynthesis monooxygenase [Solimicrobium silvestre]
MFAVIFVVHPKDGRKDEYLGLAKHLKPLLEGTDGFIDNERFESKRTEGDVLSLSTWRDEKAVVRWRTQGEHHQVQEKGRFDVFKDYHLRVGEVTADSHPPEGGTVDEKRFDETVIGEAKVCTITEVIPAKGASLGGLGKLLPAHLGLDLSSAGLVDHVVFQGITIPDKYLLLVDWKDAGAAHAWTPKSFAGVSMLRHRHVRVIRMYGMQDRREAPQYYSDAKTQ